MRKRIFGLLALIVIFLPGLSCAAQADETGPTAAPAVAAPPTLPPSGGTDAYGDAPVTPAADYFPILPLDADPDTEETPQLLPVASNHALSGNHERITRAIIVIHDVSRDAGGAMAMLAALAGANGDETLILAPQFMLSSDIARYEGHLPDEGRSLARWPLGAWEDGGESTARAPQKGVSSFTAIDLLLLYLGEKKIFPALKDIVIAGNGAGGDFALRYAALGQAPDLLDTRSVSVRFAAANASSYLYFTSLRPRPFKPGFALPDATACPDYNAYKYGLNHLDRYGQRSGSNAIRLRYPGRRVIVLAGARPGAEDRFPDMSCAALLQGPDRLMRAANYDLYIHTIFSDAAENTQSFAAIPGAGYDAAGVFGSPCGMSVLFGDGACAPSRVTNSENSRSPISASGP